jgi:hypothetical protein
MQQCSICGQNYEGYGNNAQPVNDGRCCDKCNVTIVVPRRIQDHITMKGEKY